MKKKLSWLLVLGLFTLLSACGGSGGDPIQDNSLDTTDVTVNIWDGSPVADNQIISIQFNQSMDPSISPIVSFGGSAAGAIYWTTTELIDDTLTIHPDPTWLPGENQTLKVLVYDADGNEVIYEKTYSVYTLSNGKTFYVSTSGDDAVNDGLSVGAPKQTIQAAIAISNAGDRILVASGVYNIDSQAGAGNYIVLLEGIWLFGGYNADFSSRNPDLYETIINDTSTTLGTNLVVEAVPAISTATVLDGFIINASTIGNKTIGIYNDHASPTIRNNQVNGGDGTSQSIAIMNIGSLAVLIRNNIIHGGSSFTYSSGIYNSGYSAAVIENNIINGGGAMAGASSAIDNQTSTGGPPSRPLIQTNIIHGGIATSTTGITNHLASPIILNNIIRGGDGGESFGIFNHGSSAVIQNNTVFAGYDNSIYAYAIFNATSIDAVISNNILFTTGKIESLRYCFYESEVTADPVEFMNNDLFDCPTGLYYDFDTTAELTVINDVNILADIVDTGKGGNVSVDPLFADRINYDWHLTSFSPLTVTEGGLDLSPDITTDLDGKSRTQPWSMGAYEY